MAAHKLYFKVPTRLDKIRNGKKQGCSGQSHSGSVGVYGTINYFSHPEKKRVCENLAAPGYITSFF